MATTRILVLDRGEDLAEQVRQALPLLQTDAEVVACDRVADVGDLLTEEGPFEVLVAGPSLGTRSGLGRLELIHDELPAMSMVLAFTHRPNATLRDIVRIGAVDLVLVPFEDKTLAVALDRAVSLAAARSVAAAISGPAFSAPYEHAAAGPSLPAAPGRVFTISSATGGCGKTFYATNLAWFLAHHTGRRACVVDLDLQFGEVSTALRLRPRYTIYDALQQGETSEVDLRAHIEEHMSVHETGIHVLAAPKDPADADRISPPDVTRILEAVRSRFDYVIVDTPAALTEVVLAALDLSDELYVLATHDLPSVRNMGVFLNTLDKLKIPSENVMLILNKAERDVGIDVDQILKLFPQGFRAVLPYDRQVSKSINMGTPVLAYDPAAEVSRRMAAAMATLLPPDARARVEEAGAHSHRRSFLHRGRTLAGAGVAAGIGSGGLR
ncbi:MAG: AAA family ATPase [Acidimicrobiales bacterium]